MTKKTTKKTAPSKPKATVRPIDNVTTTNLDMALRLCGFDIDNKLIDERWDITAKLANVIV